LSSRSVVNAEEEPDFIPKRMLTRLCCSSVFPFLSISLPLDRSARKTLPSLPLAFSISPHQDFLLTLEEFFSPPADEMLHRFSLCCNKNEDGRREIKRKRDREGEKDRQRKQSEREREREGGRITVTKHV